MKTRKKLYKKLENLLDQYDSMNVFEPMNIKLFTGADLLDLSEFDEVICIGVDHVSQY